MRSPEKGRITWGSRYSVAQGKASGKVCHCRIYKYIPALVLPYFYAFFFHSPCNFTLLLNLRPFVFDLTPSGWPFISIANIIFDLRLFKFTAAFSGTKLGRKTSAGCLSVITA